MQNLQKNEEKKHYYSAYLPLETVFRALPRAISLAYQDIALDYEIHNLSERIKKLKQDGFQHKEINPEEIRSIREDVKTITTDKLSEHIYPFVYRPYDIRFFFHNPVFAPGLTDDLLYMDKGDSIHLVLEKHSNSHQHSFFFYTTRYLVASCFSGRSDVEFVQIPLFSIKKGSSEKQHNFQMEFIQKLEKILQENFSPGIKKEKAFTSEDILNYFLAVLFSEDYENLHHSGCKEGELPRFPLPDNSITFHKLSEIGKEIASLFLLEKHLPLTSNFLVSGDNAVNKVTFIPGSPNVGKLYINETQLFDDFPEEIWNFKIGACPLLKVFLERKANSNMNREEIVLVQRISSAILNLIRIKTQLKSISVAKEVLFPSK
ncbi:MAG: hypothetical protein H7A25_03755 [Leptospiraceae bacterium]|nr:hypothetical protein [Leptospiraceae bacterium]MCP5498990.1 hypothetical protein [Leptospiraceae bacterium]